jgi:gliding motility-associated-like protein
MHLHPTRFLQGFLFLVFMFFMADIHAQCQADAGPNITICQGESVQLGGNPSAFGGNGPYVYDWNNGANDVSNPTVSPNVTTTYTLEIEDVDGCDDDDQITVTVLPSPNAGFNASPLGQCANVPITFTNTTTACPSCQYSWDFDDGTTSTLTSPSHTFDSATGGGTETFTVTLTITAANGCEDTQTMNIQVDEIPDPVLEAPITGFSQCNGDPTFTVTVFDNSSPGNAGSYSIDWGDGSPPWTGNNDPQGVSHTYTGSEVWDLVYTVTGNNGCSNSETIFVSNITNPSIGAANPGGTQGCGPLNICFPLNNYAANHPSTTYIVDFGDGSPSVTLNHPPPTEICHNYSGTSCVTNPSGYTFSITAQNNCDISVATVFPVKVYNAPAAAFTPTPVPACVNTSVTFINNSVLGYNQSCSSTTQFTWNFGDGSAQVVTLSSGNQSHVYSLPGTYTVTLTAANSCGNSTATQQVCIETVPTPLFTATPLTGCTPLNVNTDNLSNNGIPCSLSSVWLVDYIDAPCNPDNGAYSYLGGTNSSSLEPQFQFTSVGTYIVRLQMSNSCGTFEDSESVVVNTVPEVALTPLTTICAGGSVSPSAVIDNCGLTITNYNWSMTGGSPASSSNASPGSVIYANSGNYTVSLTATNACGPSTASTGVNVLPIPDVQVDSNDANDEICAGSSVTLTATGAGSYTWTGFGSGSSITVNPTVTTVYNVTGFSGSCQDASSFTITVNPLPIPSTAGTYTICAGQSVVLGANVGGGTAPYVQYVWTPNATLTGANTSTPTASPITSTNYNVAVTDSEGCTGNGTVPVTVNPLPAVNAGPDITLCDQPVATPLTGQTPAGGIWSGLNVTAGGVFTPSGTGTFTLTYTFTNASGCINSDTRIVTVIAPTTPSAGPNVEVCQNATGVVVLGTPVGGTWSGPNVTSAGSYTPSTVGTFTLTYTYGTGSCTSTDQMDITVNALPIVNAGPDDAICLNENTFLNGTVNGGEMPYGTPSWTNGTTLSSSTILNPTATPLTTTTYMLTVQDNNLCSASDAVIITVNTLPVVNAGPDITLCDQPFPVTLTGYSPTTGGTGVWTGPNVTAGGIYTPSGQGTFNLTYTFTNSTTGCINSDVVALTVVGVTTANAGPNEDLCLNSLPFQLPTGGTWTGSPLVTAGGLFTPNAVGTYTLTFTTGVGTCQTSDQMIMEVLTLPTSNAGPDQTVCAGIPIQLDGGGTSPNGAITLYSWSGGVVSNSLIEDPTANYVTTTTLNLTIVDAEGCTDQDQVTIFVNPLPVVNAGPDLTLCDQPIPQILTGYSPTAGGVGVWSGSGVTPGGTFTPFNTGIYNLTYTFTNANGCISSDGIVLTVNAPVSANAGPDVELCLNNGSYQLTGFVPAVGGTWSGTGITNASTGIFNPAIAGVGIFTLTITYGTGTCYTTDQMVIEVLPLPVVSAGINQTVCGNQLPFDLPGFSPLGGTWEGSGITNSSLGTFDPAIGTGNYFMLYWYTDPITGCADSSNITVSVSPVPIANFTLAPLGCTNAQLNITNTSAGGTTYDWDYGNTATGVGFDPPYIYPDEGIYDVTLIVENAFGCLDTAMNSTEIIDPPQAIIDLLPNEGCAPLTVDYMNTSTGQYLTWEWNLGIGSSDLIDPANLTYPQGDSIVVYPISLIASNFCGSSIANDEVTVNPQPIASFGTNLSVFCSPFTVEFNNTSVGLPDTNDWDFGDETTGTMLEPGTHIYFTDTIPTDYTITLIVENECGVDTTSQVITVLPNIVTAFFNTSVVEGCAPLEVQFTDYSENGTFLQYNFGDETYSGDPNPLHTFTSPGLYTVYQYVDNGCSFDTTQIQIEVIPSPVIDFVTDVNSLCALFPVQFDSQTNELVNLSWDFDDGSTSLLSDPSHSFDIGGTYNVQLTAESPNGCISSIEHPVTVSDAPEAEFTVPAELGCSPFTVNFTSTTIGGAFFEYDFGDNNTANGANVSHTYTSTGADPVLYTVTMIAENMQLCADTFELDIIVAPQPLSSFILSSTESCSYPVQADAINMSQWANGYEWYVNNVLTSELNNPDFIFDAVGSYDVELVANNQYGCTHSSSIEFVVHPVPNLGITALPIDGCVDLFVNFQSTNSGAPVSLYLWNFGDGGTGVGPTPTYTYDNAGVFDVSLIGISEAGCSDTLEVADYVHAFGLPIADFSYTPDAATIYDPTFVFIDNSYNAYAYFWEFGDGATSPYENIEHTFASAGTYTVNLTVWSDHGCIDERSDIVQVEDLFNIYVPNAFTPDDDGINEVFKPEMSGTAFIERYNFKIFDRWGTVVFDTNDPNEPWLGNVRDGEFYVKDDAYNWTVTIQLKYSDEERVYTGHVIQVR